MRISMNWDTGETFFFEFLEKLGYRALRERRSRTVRKPTLAAHPPLSASLPCLGSGSLERQSWLRGLPNSVISLRPGHPVRVLRVKRRRTIFFASSGSACAGDEGDTAEGPGLGVCWVDVGDEDMMRNGMKGDLLIVDIVVVVVVVLFILWYLT